MNSKGRFGIFIIVYIVSLNLWASTSDSLVRLSDLSFKNEVEKRTFVKFSSHRDSVDVIDLFITPYDKDNGYSSAQTHQRISECVTSLQKEIKGKSELKKVKFIYDYVHKIFFKVYKLKNSFSDIFERGEYNCVSASALYAIIFSRLGVSYQIKETPEHIYLVADPKAEKILIETTSPEKGYYQFNNAYVEKYVKSLYDSKTITKEEYESAAPNVLFNKYYFSSTDISLIELAGLQYNNYSLYDIEDKNYEKGISDTKKAYFLNPCIRTRYILKASLLYQVGSNNYDNLKQVSHLRTLCLFNNINDNEITDELIRSEFSRIIQTQLINNSDYEKFDSSHEMIAGSINDTALKNNIDFDYHMELGRLGYINSKDFEYEMKHLEAAYQINPRNANLQGIILAYFGRVLEKNDDPKSVMILLDGFKAKFDFVNDNKVFNNIKANCLLELSFQSSMINEFTRGENYLKDFEMFCDKKKDIEPNSILVERAYASASGMYYKRGNYAKAKQLLKKGLQYAPNNFGLKQRLSQF